MGIWESALILLGIGIVSERFGAGIGLGKLGVGIESLAGAPLRGVGGGLFQFSTGLRSFAEALGDIGRGFGELFKHVPALPPVSPEPRFEIWPSPLQPKSGGDPTTLLSGGGGNVPKNGVFYTRAIAGNGWTFTGASSYWKTEKAAIKHYREAQEIGGNLV